MTDDAGRKYSRPIKPHNLGNTQASFLHWIELNSIQWKNTYKKNLPEESMAHAQKPT